MNYQYFGLLATIILFCGLAFVPYRWPSGRHKTFSQHVALRRSSTIYYSLLFLIVLPILIAFFVNWFTPHFGITTWLNVLIIVSALFQISCTLVPERGGRMTTWHRALAGLSAIFLVPALALLLAYPTISFTSKVLTTVSLFAMASCVYLVMIARGNPRNFLLIQCTYFSAFLLPIMFISYLQ